MKLEILKKAVADEAKKQGISDYELYYMTETDLSVETLKDEISSFSSGTSGGLSFRCLVGGKMGYASTELLTEDEVRRLVKVAAENAANTEKEDVAGIFAGSEKYLETTAKKYIPDDAAKLKKVALDIQKANYAASDKVVDGTQSAATTHSVTIEIFNSFGLNLTNSVGVNVAMSYAVVRDGEDTESNFELASLDENFDLENTVKKAVAGAEECLGATDDVKSGVYDIIISGRQMKDLLSAFSPAFSAKNAQLGISLLAGKEGSVVASDIVTLTDDPMREGVSMQTPFDAEGVATYRKNVIEKGVLKTLLYNLETAKKAGVASTGNASRAGYSSPVATSPYGFCIEAGEYSDDELLKLCGGGIYITELKGLHAGANPTTGDFSIESAGFMIENGKKTRAVKSFTIAGNFFELMKSIKALGNEVKIGVPMNFTYFGAPDTLIGGINVAGK